ncbi:gliding motility-associated C-terminal domain-containing protein [Pedobacter sp. P351]|uniref:gliding motility-associated C-terminal domain-containing protein n=1 Tax=Pedobacter superstes TaxID=3133441 RepID=UPI0030B7B546
MKKLLLYSLLFLSGEVFASIETIPAGAFIINLGISPQTQGNGLKPYGMVYDLLQNFSVPVKWVINPLKSKDGIDFTYNNTAYRSGSFIILAQYRTTEVNQAIDTWKIKGVIGEDTNTQLSVDVFATLTYAPKWTIDKFSGTLVSPFFVNADIPASAYGGATQSSWKNPSQLTQCDDIFILPHADPTWTSHQNLLTWNKDFKGAIWSGCHAVSVMENIVSPDGLSKMNFLTTNGMVNYFSHGNGTSPFNYNFPADPVMQFINELDDAAITGSESIYLPKAGGWRPGAKLSVVDPDHSQVPGLSPGPAAVVAYGYGFDDPNRGLVMYQGGHFHNGGFGGGFNGTPFNGDHVALQRAFFNFSFLAVVDRQTKNVSAQLSAAPSMSPGASYPVSFTIPANINISDYEVRWAASTGTIAPGSDAKSIIYTPSTDPSVRIALITLFLKDACGREFFTTQNIRISDGDDQLVVARLISANGDGRGHDYLYIKNIDRYPDNEIQIFNRWGIKVFEMKNYDNTIRSFKGTANRKANAEEVIEGVYYYILKYKDEMNEDRQLKDYFILKR